jgi:hypothetical protein
MLLLAKLCLAWKVPRLRESLRSSAGGSARSEGEQPRHSTLYTLHSYRHFSLKYTIDLYCGLKFRQDRLCSLDHKDGRPVGPSGRPRRQYGCRLNYEHSGLHPPRNFAEVAIAAVPSCGPPNRRSSTGDSIADSAQSRG